MDQESTKILYENLLRKILLKSGKSESEINGMGYSEALVDAEAYIDKPNSESLQDSKETDIIDPTKTFMKQDG